MNELSIAEHANHLTYDIIRVYDFLNFLLSTRSRFFIQFLYIDKKLIATHIILFLLVQSQPSFIPSLHCLFTLLFEFCHFLRGG